MEHHFNVEVAKVYGVEEAILIHNIFFWIKKNVANDRHKHDGRYWTYNSSKAFAELFPYFNEKKIYRLLADMCQKKILIKGNFNKNAFDRTMWYSLSDETLSVLDKEKYDISQMSESYDEKCTFHFSKMENGFSESEEHIPYSNTDSKQDNKEERDKSLSKKVENKEMDEWIDEMYSIYPAKCPCRNMSLGKCSKDKDRIRKLLKSYTREQIEKVIRNEVETKYGKAYMSNFSTFLNNFPDPDCIDSGKSAPILNEGKDKIVINGVEYR